MELCGGGLFSSLCFLGKRYDRSVTQTPPVDVAGVDGASFFLLCDGMRGTPAPPIRKSPPPRKIYKYNLAYVGTDAVKNYMYFVLAQEFWNY